MAVGGMCPLSADPCLRLRYCLIGWTGIMRQRARTRRDHEFADLREHLDTGQAARNADRAFLGNAPGPEMR